ncbi:MAG: hypothetical protein U0531_04310 [Dehalococcoidia bacterium]
MSPAPWALLKALKPSASVDEILTALRSTGVSVLDAKNLSYNTCSSRSMPRGRSLSHSRSRHPRALLSVQAIKDPGFGRASGLPWLDSSFNEDRLQDLLQGVRRHDLEHDPHQRAGRQ